MHRMVMERDDGVRRYILDWHIENFQFCWHKTGECLQSPLFYIGTSNKTCWRLLLYPRGKTDGEFISCYLFREEGGPEEVEMNFLLCLVFQTNVLASYEFYGTKSLRCFDTAGTRNFVSRRNIISIIDNKNHLLTFNLFCKYANMDAGIDNQVFLSRISMASMCGTEILDDGTETDHEGNIGIQVKSILEDEPFFNINLSYLEESLVIKISPVNCEKLKYATVKINVLKNWGENNHIAFNRYWIGDMKSDIYRYRVLFPKEKFFKSDVKVFTRKAFLLNYDFSFSTGEVLEILGSQQFEAYSKVLNVSQKRFLSSVISTVNTAPIALDALRNEYKSKTYYDYAMWRDKVYAVHKEILSARILPFKRSLENIEAKVKILETLKEDELKPFMEFLYTDTIVFPSMQFALNLYRLSSCAGLELLKTMSRNFLICNNDTETAFEILYMARRDKDSSLKTIGENCIVSHYNYIIKTLDWKSLAKKDPKWSKDIMFLNYKRN